MQHNIEQRQATELQNMIETEAALHEETNALVRACLTSHNKEIRTMMNEQSKLRCFVSLFRFRIRFFFVSFYVFLLFAPL